MQRMSQMPEDEPSVAALTIEQIADALQVSSRTIERRIAKGELRAIHVGRSRRIPISELQRILSDA
jgi:excisionase family DNA binding protein